MKQPIKIMNLKISEFLFYILILSMVFYGFGIVYVSKYFQYIDDVFVISIILIAIIKLLLKRKINILNKYDKILFFLSCILLIIGLIGNYISGYQTNIKAIFIDVLGFSKFFGTFLAGMILFDEKKGDRYFDVSEYISKSVLTFILIVVIINQVFSLGLGEAYGRYGLSSYTLGSHPSFAAAVGACCISILLLNYQKNKKWIWLGFILIALTLRIKAIAYVILMIVFLFFNKNKKSFSIKNIIFYSLIAIIIARNYIIIYFLEDTASRGMALRGAFKLATKFFPIGSGFATFGTAASTITYSKAYIFTGLNNRYGFMEKASAFVGDGGWATQIGQFGILGSIIILAMIYAVYISVKKNVGKAISTAPYISIFMYLLLCSISEASIPSNYAVLFALALVIIVKKGKIKNETRAKKE